MDFSIIVCTYNRSYNLPRCLEALSKQEDINKLNWEVLVVDNNSTDDTRLIVNQLATKLQINIRYTREERQGLNYARNRGIQETSGRYFAFVDDDILVTPKWLISIFSCFQKTNADAVGGRIHLDPEVNLPSWISCNPEMYGFLGYQDYGDKPMLLDGLSKYPFGGNMAFHRRVVEKVGYFNVDLGRKGEGKTKNELFKGAETEYFHRMVNIYHPDKPVLFYEPQAIVYHKVMPHQLRKKYFLTIHYNAGYQKAFFDRNDYKRTIAGVPLFIFPQTIRSINKYIQLCISHGIDRSFRQKMTIVHFLGQISGYYQRYKGLKR
jgi:glycosyltransferase involved in cell wall biosynthesis